MSAVVASGRSIYDNMSGRFKQGLKTFGELIKLGVESLQWGFSDIVARRFSWSEFLLQCWFMTRVSLLPTILVSIPFGVITSVQIGAAANQIGANSFIGAVNGIGVLRQGAPLVTSLMIAGAVGSAICADLGARTVREETDALMVMGISPIQRLVAPRILAALLVAVLLTVIVAVTAMITAFIVVVGGGQVSSGTYIDSFVGLSQPLDFLVAEIKAFIFGFVAVIVAAQKGLNARGGPKAVADAVNQAVVLSVILLAVINVGLTQAYVMLFPGSA
jgi:phospholipid/cholesterol/gamma-HCH transport system permease protein